MRMPRLGSNVDKLLASVVAIAAAVLIGLGVAFAFGALDSGASGPPGSVSDKCQDYALKNAEAATLDDPFVKGVVTIGFKEGPSSPQAALLLKTLGTTYYMPLPYHQTAFICVKPGYELAWVDQMKALDWVEWAHVEGVHPLLTLPH
jgi:hypothetical protein